MHADDHRLRFHARCGTLVKLSPNGRSAKRLRAFDEFNNGVVMTNRNIFDDELFEVKSETVTRIVVLGARMAGGVVSMFAEAGRKYDRLNS